MRTCRATISARKWERCTRCSQGQLVLNITKDAVTRLSQVIMIHMRHVNREDLIKQLVRKMAPPLVTLLSSPPEVQWVSLRNINL
jgi:hypothetical protein